MVDLRRPINDLVTEVLSGKLTVRQLVQASLNKITENDVLNAVLEVNPQALDLADELDALIQGQGSKVKAKSLLGIPFIAKDMFLTQNTHTTAGSNILRPFRAPYQATAIEKLEAAGAIMVAKANQDAFGHGSSNENSDFGPSKNPWDNTRVPGGSSGGSAAAVAAGMCCFALGTDTGSSVRLPASFCGVVGLKPTYGLISRSGVVAMGSSFDVVGPLANTVRDTSLVLDVMAGKDPLDSTSIQRDDVSYVVNSGKPSIKGLKVGVIKEFMGSGVEQGVKTQINQAVERLRADGAEIQEISIPSNDLALACYYILVPAEVSSNLARYDGVKYGHSAKEAKTLAETYDLSRDQGFGSEAKRRIMIGTYVLSSGYYDAYYKKAQKVRTLLIQEFKRAFEKVDVLVGPNSPTVAFKLGQKAHDPLAMYLTDVMLVSVNLVGAPAISLPVGLSEGLPVGIQIIAPQRGEARLLEVASVVEAAVPKLEMPA
jgi:aspartyl-tRNA(Asn)/glutamyl-tRNA(Gln) amidotransferase subunit A